MRTKSDRCRILREVWPIAKTAACRVGRSVGHACRKAFGGPCKERPPFSPPIDESPMPPPQEEETDFFQGCETAFPTPDHNAVKTERFPTGDAAKSVLSLGNKDAGAELREADAMPKSVPTCQSVDQPLVVQMVRPERNLDNKPWFGLMEEVIRLEGEIERLSPKLPEEARNFAEHIFARLEEILDRNGAVVIDESACEVFEGRLHQPFPARVVKDGEPIAKLLVPGWRVDERVLRRAKVEVPETDDVSR